MEQVHSDQGYNSTHHHPYMFASHLLHYLLSTIVKIKRTEIHENTLVVMMNKKVKPGDIRLCLAFRPCQSRTLGLSPVDKCSSMPLVIFNITVDDDRRSTVVLGWICIIVKSPWSHSLLHSCWQAWSHPWSGSRPCSWRKKIVRPKITQYRFSWSIHVTQHHIQHNQITQIKILGVNF